MTTTPHPNPDQDQLRLLLVDLRGLVLLHRTLGVEGYPASPGIARFLSPPPPDRPATGPQQRSGKSGAAVSPPAARTPAGPVAKPPEASEPGAKLTALREKLEGCQRCLLHRQRERLIFGQGNPGARLLIVGPAPGPAEAAVGLPFQGESGALLDRMLAAIKLSRETVYLTGLVKCATPGSRPPAPEVVRECLPHLLSQIAALKPALICTMGQEPAQALLRSKLNLLQLRGRFHDCQGIPLLPTLAPDFLLLNPEMKKAAWEDLLLLQKRLTRLG
ncbi:MAG: uracil-DNA glycosylase [Desulfurivibrio sp.]